MKKDSAKSAKAVKTTTTKATKSTRTKPSASTPVRSAEPLTLEAVVKPGTESFRGELLLYQAADQGPRLEVCLYDESVWLNLGQMAELFQVDKSGISRHLKNVFESGELQREATVANFATVQLEGERKVTRNVEYFNLDAIISVGYRVNSSRGI